MVFKHVGVVREEFLRRKFDGNGGKDPPCQFHAKLVNLFECTYDLFGTIGSVHLSKSTKLMRGEQFSFLL